MSRKIISENREYDINVPRWLHFHLSIASVSFLEYMTSSSKSWYYQNLENVSWDCGIAHHSSMSRLRILTDSGSVRRITLTSLFFLFSRSPVSKADSCTDDSRMLLRYQACPDVLNSESTGKRFSLKNFRYTPTFSDSSVDCAGKN